MRTTFVMAFCGLLTIAGAAPAAAQVTVTILNPAAPPEVDPIAIAVNVTSGPAVTSVEAKVGTNTIALTPQQDNWFGFLPATGLQRGQHELVVTATNALAQTGQATRTFTLDRLPVINVESPADYALGLPEIRAKATCTDDGGPCQLTVGVSGALLAAGTGAIDTLIRPADGITQGLEFAATDSVTGRVAKVSRTVVAHSNTRLTSDQQFTGKILDITADRALIYEDTTTQAVRIVDRATNTSQLIYTAAAQNAVSVLSRLTPTGALLLNRNDLLPDGWELLEWRAGTLTSLGAVNGESLDVDGSWAIYSQYNGADVALTLRNLTTGTNTIVDDNAGPRLNDVTADGLVVYWDVPDNEIIRYEPGPPPVTTPLTATAPPALNRYPVTDGVNVVFTRTPDSGPDTPQFILRTGDGTEHVLSTRAFPVLPRDGYKINNGWVAFTRWSDQDNLDAWLRAPDGTERKLTARGGGASIQALSDTGEVVFETSEFPSIFHRWLARADGTVVDLGVPLGKPYFIDNEWFTAAGASLLAVNPNVPAQSILSEGATGAFFTTDVAILNPHKTVVPVTIRYLRENDTEISETRDLPAMSRTTIHEDDITGLEGTSVSTVVEAPNTTPVVAERLMTWDATGYGGHLGTAVDRPRVRWFFAEGAQGFFYTFFLLANNSASEAAVKFTFLIEQGTPVSRTIQVAPGTRKTVYSGDITELINRSFATVIESDVAIVAERAMYFGDSPLWLGGHGTAGVPDPAYRWYHAEGATGSLFDRFILLANPNPVDVTVHITYTTDKGQAIKRTRVLPASSRVTINLEDEAPELADTAVSTLIETAAYPVVSERAMYWGTANDGWREAHNSFGVTQAAVKWGVAEGRSGGPRGYQTYVLVSNPSDYDNTLKVTFVKEDGTIVPYTGPTQVARTSRLTIGTADIPALANSNFSTIVESLSAVPISVESAIYWNVDGVIWEGGGNTVATPIP